MLALHTRLRFGSYDAAADIDPRRHEWPPHPARVFCALVASDPTEEEWRALHWLEEQPPPLVLASRTLSERADELFVPTNEVTAKSPNLPGRTNGSRTKPRCLPAATTFHLVWEGGDPAPEVRNCLDSLAARVPYVGRATSSAEVWFSSEKPPVDDLDLYEPAGVAADLDLRAPYPGYCRRLREAHERGDRAWEVGTSFGYRVRGRDTSTRHAPPVDGPFGRLMAFRFRAPTQLHSSLTVQIAERLRAAVMDLFPDPIPAVVCGHGADTQTHVAYLALPNVGAPGRLPHGPSTARSQLNAYADGRVLGLALALPRGDEQLPLHLYAALVSGASGRRLDRLTVSGADLGLEPSLAGSGPIGAQATRWTGPSDVWATATPLVFDRFPKRNDAETMVAEALRTAGYPSPLDVVVRPSPILPGAPTLSRSAVRRRAGVPAKPSTHAWVRFERPVKGPVIAGSMRYRGLGLFAPMRLRPTEEERSLRAEAGT